MFCRKCGAELPEGVNFCRKCGAPVSQEESHSDPTEWNQYDDTSRNSSNGSYQDYKTGYGQNQNYGYDQSQADDQNQNYGYDQSQADSQNHGKSYGYDQRQDYSYDQNGSQSFGYGQNQNYGYEKPQTPQKKNNLLPIIIIAAAVVVIAAALVVFFVLKSQKEEQSANEALQTTVEEELVTLPDVTGRDGTEAESYLEGMGFEVIVKEKESTKTEPGFVMSQSPIDQDVEKGSKVILYIAVEPADEKSTTSSGSSSTTTQNTQNSQTTQNTQSSTSSTAAVSGSSGYLLPQSASSYITKADIAGWSNDAIWKAKNEIYARHGRIFSNQTLQNYFLSQTWYQPVSKAIDEAYLSDVEKANAEFLNKCYNHDAVK